MYLVFDPCICDDPYCYGRTEFALFDNKQTALQEADIRSKRYGGSKGRPELHMQEITVSKKVSGS